MSATPPAHFAFVEKAFNAQVEHLMREQAQPAMQTQRQHFSNHHRDHRHDQRRTRRALSARRSAATFRTASGKRHTPGKVDADAYRGRGSAEFPALASRNTREQKIKYAGHESSWRVSRQSGRSDDASNFQFPRSAAWVLPAADAPPRRRRSYSWRPEPFAATDRANARGGAPISKTGEDHLSHARTP